MHHYRDDAVHVPLSAMSGQDVVKAKHRVLDGFKRSNKLARAGYLLSYLKDGVGMLNLGSLA